MIRKILTLMAIALAANIAMSGLAYSSNDRSAVAATLAKPVIRGGIVFKSYCTLCHGERADGDGRAAKLHGAEKLSITSQSTEFYSDIIRNGGKALGKSEFMPPWENELSEEQINDVVAYLQVVGSVELRGEVVFKTNCILCHGISGDGQGRAAKLYNPPPANLTMSDKNDDYKRMIITLGGKAMGRSEFMPVWGAQLSEQEINDLVAFLRTILKQ